MHADIIKAFEGSGFSLSNHFIMRLTNFRLDKRGIRSFRAVRDLEYIIRDGRIESAVDGAIAIFQNGLAIIMAPRTKRSITI